MAVTPTSILPATDGTSPHSAHTQLRTTSTGNIALPIWTPEDVAVLKDTSLSYAEVASRVGRTLNAVRNKAHRLGIQRLDLDAEPDWISQAEPLFGTMPDAEVAKVVGVAKITIVRWRNRLGYAGYTRPRRRPAWLDAGGEGMLGTMSDQKVAMALDVNVDQVAKWRRRLEIPAWQQRRNPAPPRNTRRTFGNGDE